ncbi:MAG: amidohydrolase family protein [Flavisolibacter sp.]|jgi:predicted TIM-barrel fold metal-dependent hydrolase|nr:amidohydrolase family protein [Flavisolibacter sp.]
MKHLLMISFFNLFLICGIFAQKVQQKNSNRSNKIQQTVPSKTPLPIIDMHMHANKADFAGPPPIPYCIHVDEWPVSATGTEWMNVFLKDTSCKKFILSQKTDEDVMNKTFEIMRRRNVYAVASGRLIEQWKAAAPDRIISSLLYRGGGPNPSPDSVRKLFQSGMYEVFGEIMAQYAGTPPNDPSLDPYWALLEEMNIPVGIHIGPTPIGAPYIPGWENVRARLHSPLLIEEVLVKYPKLRVYIMHAAWPMIDELLALMWVHPHVYVDISGIISDLNKPAFYDYIKRIGQAGFGNRIMFGSDQMTWPELLEIGIQTIEEADFLTPKQKRDILYNNAARFLRLTPEEIAAHHRK